MAAVGDVSSANFVSLAKPVTSFGPAGSKLGVREAGENIMNNFCHHYPDTDMHSMIPQFFRGKITELMDPRPNLTRKEEEQFRGRTINQEGEKHENVVFNMFVNLIRQTNISPTLLIMRMFEMDTKNAVGLKRSALISQLPNLNFRTANTSAENDFVILVKDSGIVFVEVKGSTKDTMVRSAEKQLANVNTIVQCVVKAITGSRKRVIPVVKLIIVPDCTDPTPKGMTPQGSYFLYKDACGDFGKKWTEILDKLQRLKSANPFSSEEFKELSQILVGIWSAKAVCVTEDGPRKYHLEQDEVDFSYVEQLKKVDTIIDTSNVRDESQFRFPEVKTNPYTNIIRTDDLDIFRSCTDIKLCYLTPAQKGVFSFHKHAIVCSCAGCGKSVLILFKVLELVNTLQSDYKVLILAPIPHSVRIRNCLQSNNVAVEMINEFPPPPSSSNVFVMDLVKFFNVSRCTLMDYDLRQYHLFVDDAQHMQLSKLNDDGQGSTFYDMGDFIEQTYNHCMQNNAYLWVMVDVLQGETHSFRRGGDGAHSDSLFLTREKKMRTYTIPVIPLSHVMRNTSEIMKFTNEARNAFVEIWNYPSFISPTPEVGHNVTSQLPLYHKLQQGSEEYHIVPFLKARIRDELEAVTKPPFSFQLSNIAIIWEAELFVDLDEFKENITTFLMTEFGTTPQTIEKQLISNNRSDIIMDIETHIMSFEAPILIFICTNSGYLSNKYYKICTRPRVSLTIVDVCTDSPPNIFNNLDTVLWKPDNNSNDIVKYTCTCNCEKWSQCMC